VIRTDGTYRFSRNYTQFPELDPQSDIFGTVAAGPNGIAWLGSTQGLFKLDANNGTYQYFTQVDGIPCVGASPMTVTPDGRVWFALFDPYGSGPHGLAWFDGTHAGIFAAPREGQPQWGGLPHAQIRQMQVREIPGAYEIWMICVSRGLAVITVPTVDPAAAPATPGPVRLALESYPNPFRATTRVAFELHAPGPVRLAVHDVSGRKVRRLVDTLLPAGGHQYQWDGRDDTGRDMPAGTYFYELTSAEGRFTQRAIRLR
jgi:hypothetical protein